MKALLVFVHWWIAVFSRRPSSMMSRVLRFLCCALTALMMLGCLSRYSTEALQSMAPGAEYAEVCVRPPTVPNDRAVFAYNMTSQRTVSDEDWEEFEEFAKTADVIYRYDPNAPEKTSSRLPWPYHTMSCSPLSAEAPPLPGGMRAIPMSNDAREALASALIDKASLSLRKPAEEGDPTSRLNGLNKQYLGDGFIMGPYVDGRSPGERIDAAGQMIRDAIRAVLPNVPGPKDEQISIIDTDAGQVIGGAGAQGAISWVPGGVFIADAMENSPQVPKPTPQFKFGQGLGAMGSGIVQIGGGTGLTLGGASMSATGVGLVAGVPTCTAGVLLVANGTITFLHGAHTVLVAACDWHELDNLQPLAAAAPKDAAGPPAPPASPAPAPAAAKPAPAPIQAAPAKPVVTPAKPAARPVNQPKPATKPSAPTGGQTPGPKPKHYGSGTKVGNTTTWVRCTGQVHHAISKTIHDELQVHATLKNVYKSRDNRFVTQAIDKAAHNGYETWHRNYERQVKAWLIEFPEATPAQFEAYLKDLYKVDKVLAPKFPNGI